jgi:nucleotide-binding universal stress UspA family protein
MEKIVVGVDGSAAAADALRWAVEQGRDRGWEVEAVLAWGFLLQHHPDHEGAFDPSYDATKAAAALSTYLERAVPGAAVSTRLVRDLPGRALVEAADQDEAELLVVGARGRGDVRSMLLGSVSYDCLHESHRPVAVVRQGMAPHVEGPRRVVVGVDGSEQAQRALRWAVDHAAATGASLEVIQAWHVPYIGADPYGGVLVLDPADFERVAKEQLERALAAVDLAPVTAGVQRSTPCHQPAAALIDAAKGAELVVVGARGLGGFAGLLLGSTSSQLVHHAPCPVVVVPDRR